MRTAPYSPAWSTRIIEATSGRMSPGRQSGGLERGVAAFMPRLAGVGRSAIGSGQRNAEEPPLHLIAADDRRAHDLRHQIVRIGGVGDDAGAGRETLEHMRL